MRYTHPLLIRNFGSRAAKTASSAQTTASCAQPPAIPADDNRRRRERGLSAFAQNQSGNIMVLATLLAVPVSGAVGLAVDYGRALYAKQQLDSAASA
ncbi:MAG: TadE/TadG family type IV pilus assembly protein, partial [Rhodoblastus sp.]